MDEDREESSVNIPRIRRGHQVPARGARNDKITPLQKPMSELRQQGFSLAGETRVLPSEAFQAILTLEPIAVMQAVFIVMEECQAQARQEGKPLDDASVWIQISAKDFERIGVTSRAHAAEAWSKRWIAASCAVRPSIANGRAWATGPSLTGKELLPRFPPQRPRR